MRVFSFGGGGLDTAALVLAAQGDLACDGRGRTSAAPMLHAILPLVSGCA